MPKVFKTMSVHDLSVVLADELPFCSDTFNLAGLINDLDSKELRSLIKILQKLSK